jgi:hypothetical protein
LPCAEPSWDSIKQPLVLRSVTQEDLNAVEARMAPCLDLYNARWIRSNWTTDRLRMICEYEAADVASVRNVQRESNAKFERARPVDVLGEQQECGVAAPSSRTAGRRSTLSPLSKSRPPEGSNRPGGEVRIGHIARLTCHDPLSRRHAARPCRSSVRFCPSRRRDVWPAPGQCLVTQDRVFRRRRGAPS